MNQLKPPKSPNDLARELWNVWGDDEPCPLLRLLDDWKAGVFAADARYVLEVVGAFYEHQRSELLAIAKDLEDWQRINASVDAVIFRRKSS